MDGLGVLLWGHKSNSAGKESGRRGAGDSAASAHLGPEGMKERQWNGMEDTKPGKTDGWEKPR